LNIHGLRQEELIAAIMAEGVTLGDGKIRPRVPELREQLEALLTEKEDLRKRAEAGLATNEDLMKPQQIESRVPKYSQKPETRAGPDSAKVRPFDGKLRTPNCCLQRRWKGWPERNTIWKIANWFILMLKYPLFHKLGRLRGKETQGFYDYSHWKV
jgi:hypothetical protein